MDRIKDASYEKLITERDGMIHFLQEYEKIPDYGRIFEANEQILVYVKQTFRNFMTERRCQSGIIHKIFIPWIHKKPVRNIGKISERGINFGNNIERGESS